MTEYIDFLLWPFLACVVLVGIHVYFGLHVIKRGIIFVDLSLAQVAALGTTLAFLLGFTLDGDLAYLFSLGFALLGGTIFTLTRNAEARVPQEAIIGIVYAVSSAASILAVSHAPEGAEHIKYILIGSLLTVTPEIVLKTAGVYAIVGIFHYLARKSFLALSFHDAHPPPRKLLWEFLFYTTFGVVVTSSVKITGVLVVFIFLVVPSVFAALLTESIGKRLWLGWLFGLVGSIVGLILSFILDTPPGATIVFVFGVLLMLFAAMRNFLK
ncbi:MAG: metal ABC transporter permease [bacterium]|jgi:zinc/manganese transport system permease protein